MKLFTQIVAGVVTGVVGAAVFIAILTKVVALTLNI